MHRWKLGFNQCRFHHAHRTCGATSYTSSNVSAFPPCSCPPCLSTSGRAGVLKGSIALNLLPFKGYLISAEAAHTDVPSSQHRLWKWRLSEARSAASSIEFVQELAAFGDWFRADICPPEWGMHQLESVLTMIGHVDMGYAVVERLAGLVERYPVQVVKCLDFLVRDDTMMWTTSTWEKAVRPILTYALEHEKETQQRAKAIISYLALHGMTNFLELLPKEQ